MGKGFAAAISQELELVTTQRGDTLYDARCPGGDGGGDEPRAEGVRHHRTAGATGYLCRPEAASASRTDGGDGGICGWALDKRTFFIWTEKGFLDKRT